MGVLTPGPDGNCVTVWVRPVVGGSSSGAGKQLTLGTWEGCSPAAVGRRRRQGVMRGSAQDLSVMVLDMEGRWCRMGCIVKEEMDLEGLHRCTAEVSQRRGGMNFR